MFSLSPLFFLVNGKRQADMARATPDGNAIAMGVREAIAICGHKKREISMKCRAVFRFTIASRLKLLRERPQGFGNLSLFFVRPLKT